MAVNHIESGRTLSVAKPQLIDRALLVRKRFHRRVFAHAAWLVWRARDVASKPERYGVSGARLGLMPEALAALERDVARAGDVVVAEVDQDGFFLSRYGPMGALPTVAPNEYLERTRTRIQLIARAEGVGIRKHYRSDTDAFMRELRALYCLNRAGCRVPAVLAVDFKARTITTSFILGRVLREELAVRGARLRDREVGEPPAEPSARERHKAARIAAGRNVLREVVDGTFIQRLHEDMVRAHREGVILNDIKYGNVVIESGSGEPYWIDFDRADYFAWRERNPLYQHLVKRDEAQFAAHFAP